jgi:hypothetical protein
MSSAYICDHNFPSIEPQRSVFEDAGFHLVEVRPVCATEEDVIERCREAEVLLVQKAPITRRVMEALPSLRGSCVMELAWMSSISMLHGHYALVLLTYRHTASNKFCATYCTQLLRSGLDLRTVRQMMGHSDIASAMRYLRPQEHAHTQAKINSIQWTK